VNVDWASTFLFVVTFLMGLLIIGTLAAVAYHSGKVEGPHEASPAMHRLGRLSIALLLVWIAVVAGLGVVVSLS
jgi:heme/copper-type cytochrome/quinol oxidase subunit 2